MWRGLFLRAVGLIGVVAIAGGLATLLQMPMPAAANGVGVIGNLSRSKFSETENLGLKQMETPPLNHN